MSKPVTNEEVEDVLSSIRRLVSEDKRPLAGLRAAPPDTRGSDEMLLAKDPASDRLVLTQALRVTEPVETPLDLGAVAERTWPPQDKADAASEDADVEALVHSTLDISEQDGEDQSDYSDQSYWDADNGETGKGNTDKDETWKEATDSAAVDRSAEIVDDTDVFEDDPDGSKHRPEAVLGQSAEEDGDSRTREEAAASMAGAETARVVPQAHYARGEGGHDVDETQDGDTRDSDTDAKWAALADTRPSGSYFFDPKVVQEAIPDKAGASLTAKIAALEAAVGETVQEWEPEGGEAEDLTSSDTPTMAWEDDVELDAKGSPLDDRFPGKSIADADADADADAGAQIRQEAPDDLAPQKEAQADGPPIAAAFGTGDDQIMDEDALRDLVSEIVREELQGALGERITRNVRKLVRREIHRALTAQEME